MIGTDWSQTDSKSQTQRLDQLRVPDHRGAQLLAGVVGPHRGDQRDLGVDQDQLHRHRSGPRLSHPCRRTEPARPVGRRRSRGGRRSAARSRAPEPATPVSCRSGSRVGVRPRLDVGRLVEGADLLLSAPSQMLVPGLDDRIGADQHRDVVVSGWLLAAASEIRFCIDSAAAAAASSSAYPLQRRSADTVEQRQRPPALAPEVGGQSEVDELAAGAPAAASSASCAVRVSASCPTGGRLRCGEHEVDGLGVGADTRATAAWRDTSELRVRLWRRCGTAYRPPIR